MNETFFKGTYKLPPAHWFTYRDGKMQIERYWDVDFRHPTTLSYEAAADEIDARVRESALQAPTARINLTRPPRRAS